jgi:hypothetical protein
MQVSAPSWPRRHDRIIYFYIDVSCSNSKCITYDDLEAEMRREAERKEELRKNKLGGVWTFGTGGHGQLGHGDCKSYELPTQIKSTRGLGVCQVYAVILHI